jgi:hypothetical protein
MATHGSAKHRPGFHAIVLSVGFVLGGFLTPILLSTGQDAPFALFTDILHRNYQQPAGLFRVVPGAENAGGQQQD